MLNVVTIEVTQQDIDNAVRGSGTNCPVARAARRVGIFQPSVGYGSILGRDNTRYPMSSKVVEIVKAWDMMKGPMIPFTFTVRREQ